MTKDFFTDSGITHNVFVVRDVALASAAHPTTTLIERRSLWVLGGKVNGCHEDAPGLQLIGGRQDTKEFMIDDFNSELQIAGKS
ncbi:MAG: hypothetical protein ABSA64_07465 [Sedimentisphaerales bacterium]|jgi:hypothetical protein